MKHGDNGDDDEVWIVGETTQSLPCRRRRGSGGASFGEEVYRGITVLVS